MRIQIVCIRKDHGNHYNPHEAINLFGYVASGNRLRQYMTRGQFIAFLAQSGNSAYVSDGINRADCFVNTSSLGHQFVQTYADNKWSDNLLNLPEC